MFVLLKINAVMSLSELLVTYSDIDGSLVIFVQAVHYTVEMTALFTSQGGFELMYQEMNQKCSIYNQYVYRVHPTCAS